MSHQSISKQYGWKVAPCLNITAHICRNIHVLKKYSTLQNHKQMNNQKGIVLLLQWGHFYIGHVESLTHSENKANCCML